MGPVNATAATAGADLPLRPQMPPTAMQPEHLAYHGPVNRAQAAADAFQRVLEATRAAWPVGGSMSSVLGFNSVADFAGDLSKSHAKSLKGMQDMLKLDLTQPESVGRILGATIEMQTMGVQTKFVASVSSKISDGANKLLNSQ